MGSLYFGAFFYRFPCSLRKLFGGLVARRAVEGAGSLDYRPKVRRNDTGIGKPLVVGFVFGVARPCAREHEP